MSRHRSVFNHLSVADALHRVAFAAATASALWSLALVGCAGAPSYQTSPARPHKDVLECVVHIEDELDVAGYREIARREIERILRSEHDSASVPLYEVRFEFFVSVDPSDHWTKSATVRYRFDGLSDEPSTRVILHPKTGGIRQ